ncbi:MAG: ribosome small subunit-dependent GTPase A [Pseudomonadota bacterium]
MKSAAPADAPPRRGRVIVSHGAEIVARLDGELVSCQASRRAGRCVCGDQVQVSTDSPPRLVKIEPRESVFPRADRRGRPRVVAANLARVVVVVAPRPEPNRDLINRYLVACHSLELPVVLCVNKWDLVTDENRGPWEQRLALYHSLGYPVCRTSTKGPPELEELKPLITEGPAILVGQSGVGKSSLVNALLPDLDLRTRSISRATRKGRHTTTSTTWYHRPDGGPIIDSPGVWEYGIWDMPGEDIRAGFIEFAEHAQLCRFANCTHVAEPDCAVSAAAGRGEIDPERLASYRRILAALA